MIRLNSVIVFLVLALTSSAFAEVGTESPSVSDWFPTREGAPVRFELQLDPSKPCRTGAPIHFILEVHNQTQRAVLIPADLGDHSGTGLLALFDGEGDWIECAHGFGIDHLGLENPCEPPIPKGELRALAARSSVTIRFERTLHTDRPGHYGAEFWYGDSYTLLPEECSGLSPEGYVYGPHGSRRIEFVVW